MAFSNSLDFLSDDEIELVTGRQRFSAQKRMLERMKIPFIPRPDNTLLVLRSNVLRKFGIVEKATAAKARPNFEGM